MKKFYLILIILLQAIFIHDVNTAEACGMCLIASTDEFLPPVWGWVGVGVVWFFAVSMVNSYYLKNNGYRWALGGIAFYVFFMMISGVYPYFFIFYALAMFPLIKTFAKPWSERYSVPHKRALHFMGIIVVLLLGLLSIFRQYILVHRTPEEYAKQWAGTNHSIRILTELEKSKQK